MYKSDEGKKTPADYLLIAQVPIGDVKFEITWTVDLEGIEIVAENGTYTVTGCKGFGRKAVIPATHKRKPSTRPRSRRRTWRRRSVLFFGIFTGVILLCIFPLIIHDFLGIVKSFLILVTKFKNATYNG